MNDAPVNTVPGAQTTNEDTALVFSSANANYVPPPISGKAKLTVPNVQVNVKGNLVLAPAPAPEITVVDPVTHKPLTDKNGQPLKQIPISSVATVWTLLPGQLTQLSDAEAAANAGTAKAAKPGSNGMMVSGLNPDFKIRSFLSTLEGAAPPTAQARGSPPQRNHSPGRSSNPR